MSLYLFIDLLIVSIPLLLSVLGKNLLPMKWRPVLLSTSLVAVIFIVWDVWATARGHWYFNPEYISGLKIAGLPIEEILFFFVVGYSCLYLWLAIEHFSSLKRWYVDRSIWLILAGILFVGGIWAYPAEYSSLVFLLSSFVFLAIFVSGKKLWRRSYFIFFLWSYGLFLIFNTWLTALPVVGYSSVAILGWRVGTIPIEDFFYNFLLLASLVWLLIKIKDYEATTSNLQKPPVDYKNIFQKSSRTYFNSSLFFRQTERERIGKLYAFVRLADNFVDQLQPDKKGLQSYYLNYKKSWQGKLSGVKVVDDFVELGKQYKFENSWVEAFFKAMFQDLTQKKYKNHQALAEYMYGSAEVVGLMMARILKLPPQADKTAGLLGKAMQYGNFIRDIAEDLEFGRTYIPQNVLKEYGLASLTLKEAQSNPQAFAKLIHQEAKLFENWLKKAEEGYSYLSPRQRVAIATAAEMYRWTIKELVKDPWLIYQKKVKPSKTRILLTALRQVVKNLIYL